MNIEQLKIELGTDPLGIGYSGMDDVSAANALNIPNKAVSRDSVDCGSFVTAIVVSEYAALTAVQRQYLELVASAGHLPWTQNLKAQIGSLFAQGTATRANLLALQNRTGSRGEAIGVGHVTPSDVAEARRL